MDKLKYEECENCKHWTGCMTDCFDTCMKPLYALEEFNKYRDIGTVEECREAREKQIPKKPIEPQEDYGTFKCTSCGGLIYTTDEFETHKFCLMCGQAIDWRVENGEE